MVNKQGIDELISKTAGLIINSKHAVARFIVKKKKESSFRKNIFDSTMAIYRQRRE